MRPSNFLITAFAVLFLCSTVASAQTGQLRGTVKLTGADGNAAPVAGAIIDVYRTDISGDFHTKSDKKGEWVFAGLPYVGRYVVAVSAPGAAPYAQGGVRAGQEIPVDIVLQAGDGKKLTQAEALAAAKGGGGSPSSSGGRVSEADKAKAAEIAKKNEEIKKANEKVVESNKVVADSFKAGNAALAAKNYDEAVKEYDTGLAADPE
jgi:Carboxypeptidase regulatory-like domain